ncbi:MAG: kynureninase [Devosia sp.]|nr:kynureninase [Devosia sp.]
MRAFSEAEILRLDAADPLAQLRRAFELPEDVIYLDGNSLGPLSEAAGTRVAEAVAVAWGRGLIRSWNTAGWIDLPAKVGAKIAPLIGAAPGTVTVADSTSINLFKVLAVALAGRPERRVILTEAGNFPTDLYIADGLAGLIARGHELRQVSAAGLADAIDETVAVTMLTEVNYRTGAKLDMVALTGRAHAAGALTVWDLAHSAGAFPVDVAGADADFAVGCGYKYLNGGPGAPAFVYVAPRHLPGLQQPLSGWMGHATPFEFSPDYRPADSIEAMRVGTPPILSMTALDGALDVFHGLDLAAVKAKADRLFGIFTAEVAARCPELELLTPTDPDARGTQVSLRFADAYPVMQALIARGVIGDFRQPDILRFGLTPLYLRHVDVYRAAVMLAEIMATGDWDRPEFRRRAKVV